MFATNEAIPQTFGVVPLVSNVLVMRNSINDTVSIPYLGIGTWYCHWNSDQKCKKKKKKT